MNTRTKPAIWLAFSGLFLAGIGGISSTAATPMKPHYPELVAQLKGGPVWTAFGQDVTASNIYWGYAYLGPFSIIIWAFVVLFAVRAAPAVQFSKLFLGVNALGALGMLAFAMAHLLIVGQVLAAVAILGFSLAIWQSFLVDKNVPKMPVH
ncbi:hypothetical protein [Parasedimentitalea huanghaiensis]|uniref:Uncharacterized protein n=1 Tax=Parasedimentitalea huanghaiensis TaxID=2682100 RepID=A0A6L6WBV0_9RHOB|nr:hypothetical protein [Zongyanglinia huanghaiensis]MVO14708.1 hypothetical protein [Zongyanglinia huanghaiensis]